MKPSYILALDSLDMTLNIESSWIPESWEYSIVAYAIWNLRKGYLKIKIKGYGVKLSMFKFWLHNLSYNLEQVNYQFFNVIIYKIRTLPELIS